jgi:hypothetical protein
MPLPRLHEVHDLFLVALRGPDHAEEVRGVEVVLAEEGAVAAAAEHGVGIQFAVELGFCLGDDARQPDETFKSGGFGGKSRCRDLFAGGLALLLHQEIVAPHRGHQEGGFLAGFVPVLVAVVLHEVEELTRLVAKAVQEGEVILVEPGIVVVVAFHVTGHATVEQVAEIGAPGVGIVHGRQYGREGGFGREKEIVCAAAACAC